MMSRHIRDAHLLRCVEAAGCQVFDEGDVAIPSYLPPHNIPPIKNWPGPRIAWDCISECIAPYLQQPGHIPLLVGADCSIVVGTMQALMRVYGEDVHILYVDGDIDGVAPQLERCLSTAAIALWLTILASPFRAGLTLMPSQVPVIGWSDDPHSTQMGLQLLPLAEVQRLGPSEAARQAPQAIPASAPILLHLVQRGAKLIFTLSPCGTKGHYPWVCWNPTPESPVF
jgi:arginase